MTRGSGTENENSGKIVHSIKDIRDLGLTAVPRMEEYSSGSRDRFAKPEGRKGAWVRIPLPPQNR